VPNVSDGLLCEGVASGAFGKFSQSNRFGPRCPLWRVAFPLDADVSPSWLDYEEMLPVSDYIPPRCTELGSSWTVQGLS